MAIKRITKECKKCELMKALNNDLVCTWGNSESPKRLREPLGKRRTCALIVAPAKFEEQIVAVL